MKACTLNNCANGCRTSLKVASTYLWGYIDRLLVAATVKNTIIILQKCKPKARGITYFFHSKEKSHSMKIISHIYLTRNHLTLQRLYRRHYPANLYIHNLCSRPEDGLRCRQGVNPPLKLQYLPGPGPLQQGQHGSCGEDEVAHRRQDHVPLKEANGHVVRVNLKIEIHGVSGASFAAVVVGLGSQIPGPGESRQQPQLPGGNPVQHHLQS